MTLRIKRLLGWGLFSLAVLVGSGVLLADHLMPPATGAPKDSVICNGTVIVTAPF